MLENWTTQVHRSKSIKIILRKYRMEGMQHTCIYVYHVCLYSRTFSPNATQLALLFPGLVETSLPWLPCWHQPSQGGDRPIGSWT